MGEETREGSHRTNNDKQREGNPQEIAETHGEGLKRETEGARAMCNRTVEATHPLRMVVEEARRRNMAGCRTEQHSC